MSSPCTLLSESIARIFIIIFLIIAKDDRNVTVFT